MRILARLALLSLVGTLTSVIPAHAAAPEPNTPEYAARDAGNMVAAYGRIHGPGGQLRNPAYLPALVTETSALSVAQLMTQLASPTRPALTTGSTVPGWNVGNPLRAGWNGTRGESRKVAFTNRYGALLRGTVYRPKAGARDPYTGRKLTGPFPGVVITPGSVQGSEGMYVWLAQDLAERGYVVLTYDVQGQGMSETFPHLNGDDMPFCNPTDPTRDGEMTSCPGVPFQQLGNFVVGTRDATSFFTSTPSKPYANTGAGTAAVSAYNPFWRSFQRARDPRPATVGRTTRLAIIGHSMGASAVSRVQATDKRVAAIVALDKLVGPSSTGVFDGSGNTPKVPALAVQAEYGFAVTPWLTSGGSSISPAPSPEGPDPMRERVTGFDAWRSAGVDSMLVVPRASTHLEFTDIPLVMPASRYGQALTSYYVQAWLDRYLKHRPNGAALTATSMRYLEPVGNRTWRPTTLKRPSLLSFYYCSAIAVKGVARNGDIARVGGCQK